MAAKTARFVYLGPYRRTLDLSIGGKVELSTPVIENGDCFYDGSIEFVAHFISTDPDKCKLVSMEPVHALLRDNVYRLTNVEFRPCTKQSKQVCVGEDSEGDAIMEVQYSWAPAPAAGVRAEAPSNLRLDAYSELKQRLTAILGEAGAVDYIKDFSKAIGKKSGAQFGSSELATLGNQVRSLEAEKRKQAEEAVK